MPRPRRLRFLALFAALALGTVALTLWGSRPAPPRYAVTDLGVLPGDGGSDASAINSAGDVVGLSYAAGGTPGAPTVYHVFLYRSGRIARLGITPGSAGRWTALAINDRGQVAGRLAASPKADHACLWAAGTQQDLGTLPGLLETFAAGLNDRGEIVGGARSVRDWTGKRPPDHAFLFSGGHMTFLPPPPGFTEVVARGINDAGQVVLNASSGRPRQPFLYDTRTGKWTGLALPAGARWGYASALNDQGQVAGQAAGSAGTFIGTFSLHAVLWRGGVATDLGTLPGAAGGGASALNGRGEVVGFAEYEPSAAGEAIGMRLRGSNPLRRLFRTHYTSRAFVWRAGRMADLNDLIPPDSGWTLAEAQGINDRGQIVGMGTHNRQQRAFLLTPLR